MHTSSIPQALPTTTYMQVATAQPSGKVNLRELAEVQAAYLPRPVVRLACLTQLEREADAIKAKHPNYAEEVDFITRCENQRRGLATMSIR